MCARNWAGGAWPRPYNICEVCAVGARPCFARTIAACRSSCCWDTGAHTGARLYKALQRGFMTDGCGRAGCIPPLQRRPHLLCRGEAMPRPHHCRVQVKRAVHVGAGYIPPAAHKRAGRPSADRRPQPSIKQEETYRQPSRDPFRGAAVFVLAPNTKKPRTLSGARREVKGSTLSRPGTCT